MPRRCHSAMRVASCIARWDVQARKPTWELKVLIRDWRDAAVNCAANGFVADGATDGLLLHEIKKHRKYTPKVYYLRLFLYNSINFITFATESLIY